jgi:prophage regulatory protein
MKTKPKATIAKMPQAPEPQAATTPTIPSALAQFDALPDSAYVRLPVVAALHGVGPATVWRWVKAGRLPAPLKLGPNVTAWRVGSLRRVQLGSAA